MHDITTTSIMGLWSGHANVNPTCLAHLAKPIWPSILQSQRFTYFGFPSLIFSLSKEKYLF
jgi:hypothetical protein